MNENIKNGGGVGGGEVEEEEVEDSRGMTCARVLRWIKKQTKSDKKKKKSS